MTTMGIGNGAGRYNPIIGDDADMRQVLYAFVAANVPGEYTFTWFEDQIVLIPREQEES